MRSLLRGQLWTYEVIKLIYTRCRNIPVFVTSYDCLQLIHLLDGNVNQINSQTFS